LAPAAAEQREIHKAVQLDLPLTVGKPIPILYVQMDGTGVPVVKKETEGRKGKTNQPAGTREVKLGCAFNRAKSHAGEFIIKGHENVRPVNACNKGETAALVLPLHLISTLDNAANWRRRRGCGPSVNTSFEREGTCRRT
jgi:hypothetical protein